MKQALFVFILIYAGEAWSFDSESFSSLGRERASISDFIPEFEELNCEARCDGDPRIAAWCGELHDQKSCMEYGAEYGCIWTCE